MAKFTTGTRVVCAHSLLDDLGELKGPSISLLQSPTEASERKGAK